MCFKVIQPLQVSAIQYVYIHPHTCTYGQAYFTHACSYSLNVSYHSITASHTNASCSHMQTILTISLQWCMIHNSYNATFISFLISRPTIGPDPKATTLHGQRIYYAPGPVSSSLLQSAWGATPLTYEPEPATKCLRMVVFRSNRASSCYKVHEDGTRPVGHDPKALSDHTYQFYLSPIHSFLGITVITQCNVTPAQSPNASQISISTYNVRDMHFHTNECKCHYNYQHLQTMYIC